MKKVKISKDSALLWAYFIFVLLQITCRWWLTPAAYLMMTQPTAEQVSSFKTIILTSLSWGYLIFTLYILNRYFGRSIYNYLISLKWFHRIAFSFYSWLAQQNIASRWAHYNRGLLYVQTENFLEALNEFNKAIELGLQDVYVYGNRGMVHEKLKNFDAALNDFSKTIELKPDSGYAYGVRGDLYSKLENFDAALADFAKAISLSPNNVNLYLMRGWIYTNTKLQNFKAAEKDYTKAIELKPKTVDAYTTRGLIFLEMKNYPAALVDLNKAIELQPNHFNGYYNRGMLYDEMKDFPAALKDYSTAIKLNSDANEWSYVNRGLIYLKQKDFPAAVSDNLKAIELAPNDDSPVYNMACVYALQLQIDEACSWLRRAMEMSAENVEQATTDADFDLIRETPQFQALMNEFKKQ